MTPLVLLPGLMCDGAAWAPQVAALGVPCTVVDYGEARSFTAMAEIVLAAAPPGRFALAGHSMGGRVSFEVQRLAPQRVERLALLDTDYAPLAAGSAGEQERARRLTLLDLARREGLAVMARAWTRGMVHASRVDSPLFDAVVEMVKRRSVAILEAQIHAVMTRPDFTPRLAAIDCPTLVLTGRHDAVAPPEQHERMQQAIAGSRLVVIEGSGHMTTMEEPAAVNAALADWLRAPRHNPAP